MSKARALLAEYLAQNPGNRPFSEVTAATGLTHSQLRAICRTKIGRAQYRWVTYRSDKGGHHVALPVGRRIGNP